MLLSHWLKTFTAHRQTQRNARRKSWKVRPENLSCIEALEERTLLTSTLFVNDFNPSAGEYATIKEAVDAAENGDEIIITGGDDHTHTEAGMGTNGIFINKDLTIRGVSGTSQVIVQAALTEGSANSRVFFVSGATVSLKNLTIRHGNTDGSGAGIANIGGTLTIVDCTISANSANSSASGGGVYNSSTGTLTVERSTIFGNRSAGAGGGIANLGGTVMVTNTTISQNGATSHGGGVFNFNSSGQTFTAINCTITGNVSDVEDNRDGDGGGIRAEGNETLINSIVAGNRKGPSTTPEVADDISGSINTAFNNLIGNLGSSGGIINDTDNDPNAGTNNIVGNDGLGTITISTVLNPLAFNGGPTQTHALVANSRAINAGWNDAATDNNLTTDQRGDGFARILDGTVDIGAYEYLDTTPTTPTATINGDGDLEVTGSKNDDTITVTFDGTNILVNGVATALADIASANGDAIVINGGNGNDHLVVDLSVKTAMVGGSPLQIIYDGQDQTGIPGDTLEITGTTDRVEYRYTDASSGSIRLDGAGTDFITYTGLEPVTGTSLTATDVTLVYSNMPDTINITDAGNGNINVTATGTGEDTTFAAPTNSLTILAGDGNDVININSLPSGFDFHLTIDGEGGTDTINFATDLTFAANRNLVAEADTININPGVDLVLSGTGTLSLTGASIQEDATSSVTVAGITTLDAGATGTINLNAAGNDFSTLAITNAGDATIQDANAIALGTSMVGTDLSLTTGGEISQTGNLDVGGVTTLNAGASHAINLNAAGNDFGTVTITTALNVDLQDANALVLGTSTISGTLTVTTNGDLTQSGILNVAGTSTLNTSTGSITLNNTSNDFSTLIVAAAQDVLVQDGNSLTLAGISYQGSLEITAGSITNTAAITDGTTGGIARLIADAMALETGTIDVINATLFLRQKTAGVDVDLGTELGGTLSLTNPELNTITAGTITIDGGPTDDVTISAPISVDENLDINAFNITISDSVTANAVTLTNSGLLDIAAGADFNLDGSFLQQGGGSVNLGGHIITTNDDIHINDPVTLTGNVVLDTGTGAGNVSFDGTLNDDGADSNRNLEVTAGTGDVTFIGAVGSTRNPQSITVHSAANAVFASVGVADALSLTAGEIDFNGGADSVTTSGTGTLTLSPGAANQAIVIGDTANNTAALDLTAMDLAAIADGFAQITIGDETAGTGAVSVLTVTLRDAVTIVGGSIDVVQLTANDTVDNGDGTPGFLPVTLTARGDGTTPGPISSPAGTSATQEITGSTITLNGMVSPGGSPGQFDMQGNLVLSTDDTFVLELNGTTAGADYDQIHVNGNVTLGDAMLMGRRNLGFVPATGQKFTIVSVEGAGNQVIGRFAGLPNTGDTLTIDGVVFAITYNTTTVVLTVQASQTVYVDDNFANPVLGQDPDGSGPAMAFGYDSFSTIQEGINAVAGGGTVDVAAGIYDEPPLTIGKDLTLTGAGPTTVYSPFGGGNGVTLLNGASNVTIDSLQISNASDAIVDQNSATINRLTLSNLVINGSGTGGTLDDISTLDVTLTTAPDTANVSGTSFSSTNLQAISYSNVGTFHLDGGEGSDTFQVDPISSTTNLTIDGGDPTSGSPGDTLNYNGLGLVNFGSGTITQTGFQPVSYNGIETVTTANVSGANGNFTVTAGADAGDGVADLFIVRQLAGNFEVLVGPNAGSAVLVFSQPVTDVTSLTIKGSTDDETLTVDYNGDNTGGIEVPIPTGGLFYNGNGDGITDNDTLVIEDGSVTAITHNFTNAHSGSVVVQSDAMLSSERTITYTGLEPVTDTLITPTRVFNFGAASDLITLSDDTPNVAGLNRISSAGTSETVDFASPLTSLTINTGSGDDTITVMALDNSPLAMGGFNANLTINGEGDQDTFNLQATTDVDSAADNLYQFNGGDGADIFNLTPTDEALSDIEINGNDPALPTGDVLNYDGTAAVTPTGTGSGTVDPASDQDVVFTGIERVNTINAPELSIADATVDENIAGGLVTVTITLSRGVVQPVTVDVATMSGTAIAGSDFTGINQTLTFTPGGPLTQDVTISITDDAIVELDEQFLVNLSNASGATIVDGSADVAILDDDNDTPATITINNVTQSEGDTGTTNFVFTLSLNKLVDTPVSVQAATVNGTATSGADFIANTQTVTFLPGEMTKTFVVQVVGDQIVELDETFTVRLSGLNANGRNVEFIVPGPTLDAKGTIINDDKATLTISNLSQAESDTSPTPFKFTATLSQPIPNDVTATFQVKGSGNFPATTDDFVGGAFPTGMFTIKAGDTSATFTVDIAGDLIVEPDETFSVLLSGITNPTVIAGPTATGTILNDDYSVAISPVTIDRPEGNAGDNSFVYTLTRTGDLSRLVKLDYVVTGSGTYQANADDFGGTLPMGQATFNPGETTTTLVIMVKGDETVEHEEGFTVTISDPANKAQITRAFATGRIRNDDTTVISIDSVSASEATGTLTFTINASQPFDHDIGLTVNKSPITAGMTDFDTTPLMVMLTPGLQTIQVPVSVTNDQFVEADETFQMRLQVDTFDGIATDSRVTVSPLQGVGIGTIENDDTATVRIVRDVFAREADGFIDFNVELTPDTLEAASTISVQVATVLGSGTATAGADYTAISQPLVFSLVATDPNLDGDNNPFTRVVRVRLEDMDQLVERDETFDLQISDPRLNNTPDPARVIIDSLGENRTGTITDADKAFIRISDVTGSEGDPPFQFLVTLVGQVSEPVTVRADTQNGTAVAPDDYTAVVNQLVSFDANGGPMQQRTINVPIAADGDPESTENFLVKLSEIQFGGMLGFGRVLFQLDPNDPSDTTPGEAVGTIQDLTPVQVEFSPTTLMGIEGNEDNGPMTFTINLSGPVQAPVTVRVSTMMTNTGGGVDAVSTNDEDFTILDATGMPSPTDDIEVVFQPGDTTKTVMVLPTPDMRVEPDETFLVHIDEVRVAGTVQPSRAVINMASDTAIGKILNDDTANLTIAGDTRAEGNAGSNNKLTFTVKLDAEVQGGLTIGYSTQDGTAIVNEDFLALPPGTVTFGEFPDTQQVQVSIRGDSVTERDESFKLLLAGLIAQNPNAITVQTNATSTIKNDDSILVTGAGPGGGTKVIVANQFNQELFNFAAYPGFGGDVRVATGDVNGDGVPDIITVPGPDGGPNVKVFDGLTGGQISSFMAYVDPNDPTNSTKWFRGGMFVSSADIDQDGFADIIVSPDFGGGPHIKVFKGANFSDSPPPILTQFMAYGNPANSFTGGVRIATGDISGPNGIPDGVPDLITGPGPGGGPNVRVFDLTAAQGTFGTWVTGSAGNFTAFDSDYVGGIYVAAGDFGGDSANQADIVVGKGSGTSRVRIFDAADLSFMQLDAFPSFPGGVRVATVERFGDATPDLVVAAGPGGGPNVQIYEGMIINVNAHPMADADTDETREAEFDPNPRPIRVFDDFPYDPNFSGGVFVAGTIFPPTAGSPLRLAGGEILPTGPVSQLSQADLDTTVSAAVRRFELAGLDTSLIAFLANTPIAVGDLAPGLLGLATDEGILIDNDAAGAGWFVDSTPLKDEEFQSVTDQGLTATSSLAWGRVDLLTVVLHELGHALGFGDQAHDSHSENLMSETLPPNLRRLPDEESLDALFAEDHLLDDLLMTGI